MMEFFPAGDSHMKTSGMLVGKLELNLSKRPVCAWLRLYLTPKGDHAKTDNQRAIVTVNCATDVSIECCLLY